MDSTCEHCGCIYSVRDGCDATPLCDDCAHLEVERLRGVLQAISDYYLGAGHIGAMANDALKPTACPNAAGELTEPENTQDPYRR